MNLKQKHFYTTSASVNFIYLGIDIFFKQEYKWGCNYQLFELCLR